MRLLPVLILICFTNYLLAQSNFSLGADFGVQRYSYEHTIQDFKLTTTGGVVALNYQVGKKSWLELGLGYEGGNALIDQPDGLRWGTQHDGLGGFDPDAVSGEELSYKMKQKGFSVTFNAGLNVLSNKKFFAGPFITVGGAITQMEKETSSITNDDTVNYNSIGLGGGLRFGYRLGPCTIELRPVYNSFFEVSNNSNYLGVDTQTVHVISGRLGVRFEL